MRAGAKDRRIKLQRVERTKDRAGGGTATWVDVPPSLWAGVRNYSGSEVRITKYGGEVDTERTEFLIWYRAGIDTTMRVVFEGRCYNIRHINDVRAQRRELLLTCDFEAGAVP